MKQKKYLFLILIAFTFTFTGCDTIKGFFKKDTPELQEPAETTNSENTEAPTNTDVDDSSNPENTTDDSQNTTDDSQNTTDDSQNTTTDPNSETSSPDSSISFNNVGESNTSPTQGSLDMEQIKGTINSNIYTNSFNNFEITAADNWKISYSNLPYEQNTQVGTLVKPIIVSLLDNDVLTTIIPAFQYSEDPSLLLTMESYIEKLKLENDAFALGLIKNISEPKETKLSGLPFKYITYDVLDPSNLKATPSKCYAYLGQKDNNVYIITMLGVNDNNKQQVGSIIKSIKIG